MRLRVSDVLDVFPLPLMLLAALILAGCAGVEVNHDYDQGVDFSRLRGFAWQHASQPASGDPRVDSALMDRRIRAAVDRALAARGMHAAPDGPDVLVRYTFRIQRGLVGTGIHPVFGMGYGSGGYGGADIGLGILLDEDSQGVLIIELADPRSGAVLWQGSGTASMSRSGQDPDELDRWVERVVEAVFKDFPPGRES